MNRNVLLSQMKESQALYCLRVTAPFKLKHVSSFRSKQIHVLDLHACVTVASIPLLVQIIKQQPSLKSLGLAGNNLDSRGPDNLDGGLATLMACVAGTESLGITSLNLSDNKVNKGASVSADGVKNMGALTSLNISNNSIVSGTYIKAPREGIRIGDIVDGNPVLKEKDRGGEIKILQLDGIKALADSVKHNRALVTGCTVVIDGLTKSPALNGKEAMNLTQLGQRHEAANIRGLPASSL